MSEFKRFTELLQEGAVKPNDIDDFIHANESNILFTSGKFNIPNFVYNCLKNFS